MLASFKAMFKGGKFTGPIEQVRLGAEEGPSEMSLTCDSDGNIVSDTSAVPANILEQLKSPYARDMIKKQRRVARNGAPVVLPKPRFINEGTRRSYVALKPVEMSSKEFRRLRRKEFRNLTKEAITEQRRIQHAISKANHAAASDEHAAASA